MICIIIHHVMIYIWLFFHCPIYIWNKLPKIICLGNGLLWILITSLNPHASCAQHIIIGLINFVPLFCKFCFHNSQHNVQPFRSFDNGSMSSLQTNTLMDHTSNICNNCIAQVVKSAKGSELGPMKFYYRLDSLHS